MAKVDPNDKQYDQNRIRPVGTMIGDFVALGFEHFVINGKKVVEIRSVCVNSSPKGEEGGELRDLFFLHSPGAIGRFVAFAKQGCGWTQPFDPEDPADVAQIIGKRPFRAKVKATEEGQYIRHECGWDYSPPRLEKDPSDGSYVMSQQQIDALGLARKAWDGYLKWRAQNPRDAKRAGSGGGGAGSDGGSRKPAEEPRDQPGEYDDVPF